jgi:hypothetical protein
MSCAPAEHFECSGFFDAALMLHSISHSLDNHPGSHICRCAQFHIVHLSPRCFPAAAVAVKSIDISSNHLKPERLPDLLLKLRSFSVLERITISDNPDLRVLSFEFMQFVSQLKHFNCTDCSLVVPPQRMLTSPDHNPKVIGSFIKSVHIDISELQLMPALATAISSILQDVAALRRLTMYGNPNLRDQGVTRILSCLSGTFLLLSACLSLIVLLVYLILLIVATRLHHAARSGQLWSRQAIGLDACAVAALLCP